MVEAAARSISRRALATGFTYLWILIAIAVLGVGLLAASELWVSAARREKMVELDWVGGQFIGAIGNYYQATPGLVKSYPTTMQELIEDRRYVSIRRHLRSIYANPFTGQSDWEYVRSTDGKIRGVRAVIRSDGEERKIEYVYQPGAVGR